MSVSRRLFLTRAALTAAAVPALQSLSACASAVEPTDAFALTPEPDSGLALAPGLRSTVLSRAGDMMSDGLLEPRAHDGMGAFAIEGDAGRCVLIRNHEMRPNSREGGAWPDGFFDRVRLDPRAFYDIHPDGRPLFGGTTSLIVNVREARVEQSFLSLAGTATNCAGGVTPWGSWLTCEETQEMPGANAGKPHGYVFEVPSTARGLAPPTPLEAMGRFRHEAAAIDPATGAVYQTEDDEVGLFYRFLPNVAERLAEGGRLQALALRDAAGADTRNWGGGAAITVGQRLPVRWVDLEDVTAPDGDLRQRGRAAGAAIFARGEGMVYALEAGRGVIYFACTTGGAARKGQVWRLIPDADGDMLELFAESASDAEFDMVDNITVAPWGDLILCEDGDGDNYVRGLTPQGRVYPIARNSASEFCGACFSPDGSTLFVNVQRPGITYAIQGDWASLARAARR